jgi:hypothetical protein
MSPRTSLAALACLSLLAGCSESGPDPRTYTVSYRNQVRVPGDGQTLTAEGFAAQLRTRDPVSPIRCGSDESPAYREVSAFLGGIAWSHPMAIIKDRAFAPLYTGKRSNDNRLAEAPNASGAADAAPVIERPDLVGVQSGVAIFLSKQHGLVSVDLRSGAPKVSCSMKLPGQPKNFLFRGNELVVVVNAHTKSRSALLRYAFEGAAFRFVDAVRLKDQTIQDARLFDSTIVAYTQWTKPNPAFDEAPEPTAVGAPRVGGGGMAGGPAAGAPSMAADPAPGMSSRGEVLGTKVIVVQWDDALAVDWEDSLENDPTRRDPLEGTTPGSTYTPGQVIAEAKTFKPFVAASDRYLVVPRDVRKTKFVRYETYTYQVCTNYNPRYEQYESCSVKYERRDNPDYRAPNPQTGDYSCNGKSLADCIQEAAPTVSQYIYVPVGQSCQMQWRGRCEAYETRSTTYPRFETESATEMTIYRFAGGSFTRLDSSLGKMIEKTGAIAFEKNPLSVPGAIANRNQIQFQNGHLYVFADQALQTMSVAGNSVTYLNRLAVAGSTDANPAIAFSSDRAMISAPVRDRYQYQGGSAVTMVDLSIPSRPKGLNGFTMPGQSTQLILASGGILGPGQVSFTNARVSRTLQKLTLFSRDGGQELDNLLLGTEYDAFETSWFGADDDQRIRLGAGGRLFLPYSGRHHADVFEPTAHRLNISRVEGGRLVSERSFQVSDDIVRTAAIDDNRSLVFANSAVYVVDHTSGDWTMTTLRELFVPFATYRVDDKGLHARVDRVGSKCRVTTYAGDAGIFGAEHLAEIDVACPENGLPIGYGKSLLFGETRTGVRISDDGRALTPVAAAEVEATMKRLPSGYCYIVGGDERSYPTEVEYLDGVPDRIACE